MHITTATQVKCIDDGGDGSLRFAVSGPERTSGRRIF